MLSRLNMAICRQRQTRTRSGFCYMATGFRRRRVAASPPMPAARPMSRASGMQRNRGAPAIPAGSPAGCCAAATGRRSPPACAARPMPRWCWSPPISTRARCCCCPTSPSTAATSRFDPRVSLLFDGTEGHPDPLAGPRLTVLGRAEAVDDPRLLARFTARHPSSVASMPALPISASTGSRSSAAIWSPDLAGSNGSTAGELLFVPRYARARRGRAGDPRADQRGSCRRDRILCTAPARARRQRLADDRHRSRKGPICAAPARPPGSISPPGADPRGGARRARRPRRGGARIALSVARTLTGSPGYGTAPTGAGAACPIARVAPLREERR